MLKRDQAPRDLDSARNRSTLLPSVMKGSSHIGRIPPFRGFPALWFLST
jgi:hypothetical protein